MSENANQHDDRVSKLSPEKQALLAARLKAKRAQVEKYQQITPRVDLTSQPLSFAQRRMWFLSQWEPESPFYNITSAVRVQGKFEVEPFKNSINEIVRRHEILRAHYITVKGQPVQVIEPQVHLDISLRDLTAVSEGERESLLNQIISDEAHKPFDLGTGPLIRCSIIHLADRDHVILLTVHHIVSDGWSMSVLIREALLLYDAYLNGKPSPLPELSIQYADYAAWQPSVLEGDELQRQLKYWVSQLGDASIVLELPTDRARPTVQTFNGSHLKFLVPLATSNAFKELSKQQDATLFMSLLAAFQVLLHRYSGQEDIRVGTPIANRNRKELEGLIGLFVNTLVMRADFSDDSSFLGLLRQVREMALGAYANQDLPLEMLLDQLKVGRDLSRTPLYQVMFTLQETQSKNLELPAATFTILEPESDTAKFDLLLFIEDTPDGFVGSFEFNTDLFNKETIDRMAGHFTTLLASIVENPSEKVSKLALLTIQEHDQILLSWNKTFTDYPWDKNLTQQFDSQVIRSPNSIAVSFPDPTGGTAGQSLTYHELNEQANRLAHYLQKLGIRAEEPVGLYLERSLQMVVATLGIIKSGGAYLPLDLNYPKDRLAFMLDDTNTRVVLTNTDLKENISDISLLLGSSDLSANFRLITLDGDNDQADIASESSGNPICPSKADSLAYIMYTSGSTGKPKGVAITQRAITRLLVNTNYLKLGPDDRITHASNPSFDAATFEIWGALLHGGQLIIVSKDTALSAIAYAEFIRTYQITAMFVTTALFNHIVYENPKAFQSVRLLMFGGEAADVRAVRQVLENGAPDNFLNVYGPTESTTFATFYPICEVARDARSVPIGKPIANTQVYVLDRNLEPVPIGIPGELYISGDGLAREYFRRPELTAERFIPNPHLALLQPTLPNRPVDTRLYKTGDRVRYFEDGNIEFLGRYDFQVKLRGLRIEMGEIETALSSFPLIQENIVIIREDIPGDKRLVAYVVPRNENPITISELRRYLKEKLPEFMVPSAFVILERLPINPNGKVDRNALPAPDQSRPDLDKAYHAPSTPVERYLVNHWQEVLGIDHLGIYDDFFELGGDSLKAAVLMNRLQEEFGATTHVRALFMAPTVADLAHYMDEYYPHAVEKINKESGESPTSTSGSQNGNKEKGSISPGENGASSDHAASTVSELKISRIRQIIHPLPSRSVDNPDLETPKNPPAVFVLSPPRSGSTLLRTMLAGNPNLFSPPELDLLSFNTLAERRAAFSGVYTFWLEGVERAIMELQGCTAPQARQMMLDFEQHGMTIKQFYRLMQDWIQASKPDGKRILVDKTPVYSLDVEIFKRMEQDFNEPYYIHLIRHPIASVRSFIEAKLDGVFFRYKHPFNQHELAELVWIISHQNILDFLRTIPESRKTQLYFESMVGQPEVEMQRISNFLGIEFDPNMLKPYEGDRMTTGVRPGAQMVGDFKFYLRKDIDPKVADRWKNFGTEKFLSEPTWVIAEKFGYPRPDSNEATATTVKRLDRITPIPRDQELPLSFGQQRLWFLDQWEPGSPYYNIPTAVRITGRLNVSVMEQTLNEIIRRHEVLRTSFSMVDGRPILTISDHVEIPWRMVDLTDLPADERERQASLVAQEEARWSFNLATGPLFRACLIQISSATKSGSDDYLCILTMHHIVSDGWSTNVLVREMAALYPAFLEGRPSPLPELSIQYVDYASWHRQWLRGSLMEQQLTYWHQRLAGAPALLELPADRPRPAVQTQRGARIVFDISPELSARLRLFCQQEESTMFMTLLAAFNVLLYRYSNQEDICIGTPIANRNRVEIESLIGFFVNTLVLRSDLSGKPSFHNLLKQIKQVAIDAYDHQDVPFEKLVDELHLERNQSHTPLFQVMFTLQESPIQLLKLPGMTMSHVQLDSGAAKFDLLLTMVDRGSVMKGVFEYNIDLFDESTIERMIGHFQVLLEGIIENPNQSISQLPILSHGERQKLLVDWNKTIDPDSTVYLRSTIHDLFEQQVHRTPYVSAVSNRDDQITYQELNQKANQLARYLKTLGVGRDVIVGLCVERSIDALVGIIGILKSGGAYLPLDPEYPIDRLNFILNDAHVPVLLTQEKLKSQLNFGTENISNAQVICLDSNWSEITQASDTNLDEAGIEKASPSDLAYVIYTSGSTGKPKGVMIEHRTAINLWLGLNQAIYQRHGPAPLMISLNAPLPFDASVQEWLMLLSGHTLVIIPQDVRQDGDSFLQFINQSKLDVLDCVPSQLKMLLSAGLLSDVGHVPQAVLPGGEAIDRKTWDELAQSNTTEFYNMYGPTECTVDSTICRVKDNSLQPSIGRPIVNSQMYILDGERQPVPLGVFGELWIGGGGVGRGYLYRPGLTAERFIDNPFLEYQQSHGLKVPDGDRLYRTGDLVRYLPNGYLDYAGRVDFQVKVRGFRIELGEIENVLTQAPGIAESVVIVREDIPGEKQIVAYVVQKTDLQENLTVGYLRTYLKSKLPDYMVPGVFVTLDQLPLTPNRKIDRKALPKPEGRRLELGSEYQIPRTQKEETIANIWAQVLKLEKVGINDNFFELGGDSILSIQVVARAKQAGLRLTPRDMFVAQTVADLAALADQVPVIHAEQEMITGSVPLTAIQRHFFEQEVPNPSYWNQSVFLEVRFSLQIVLLQEALHHLMRHHDILRARFHKSEEGWSSYISPEITKDVISRVDLNNLSPADQSRVIEIQAIEAQTQLNIEQGKLVSVRYFDYGFGKPGKMLIVLHHLVVDGVSWRVFLEDLQTVYFQLSEGLSVELPPKTTSFLHWSTRVNQLMAEGGLSSELPYWQGISDLSGQNQSFKIPVDYPQGKNLEEMAQTVRSTLDQSTTDALLRDVPSVYHTEINDVLLSALVRTFQKWTGRSTLTVDLEGHGREPLFDDVDLSRTMGWFTSLYPVHLEIKGSVGVGETLIAVKEQLRQIPNKGIGYGLLRYLSPSGDLLSDMPESQVSFNYLGQLGQSLPDDSPFSEAPDPTGPSRDPMGKREYLIDVTVSISQGQLRVEWIYSDAQYRSETIEQLVQTYVAELKSIIEHCLSSEAGGYSPSDFPEAELSQEDLDDLLGELGFEE